MKAPLLPCLMGAYPGSVGEENSAVMAFESELLQVAWGMCEPYAETSNVTDPRFGGTASGQKDALKMLLSSLFGGLDDDFDYGLAGKTPSDIPNIIEYLEGLLLRFPLGFMLNVPQGVAQHCRLPSLLCPHKCTSDQSSVRSLTCPNACSVQIVSRTNRSFHFGLIG